MFDFMLEHPFLVGRLAVPILVCAMACLGFAAVRAWGRRRLAAGGAILGFAVCGFALILRLGPLAPFAETAEQFSRWKAAGLPRLVLTRVRDGSHFSLSTLRGRVVVVNIWATWCPPCRAEMPDLVRLAKAHPDGDVAVVSVSDEPADRQLRFAAEHGLPKDAVSGTLGWNMGTFRPFTFILDRDGRVREFYFGARSYSFFEDRVRRLLPRTAG